MKKGRGLPYVIFKQASNPLKVLYPLLFCYIFNKPFFVFIFHQTLLPMTLSFHCPCTRQIKQTLCQTRPCQKSILFWVPYSLLLKTLTFLAFSHSNIPLLPDSDLNVPLAFRPINSFQKGFVLFVEPLICLNVPLVHGTT